MGNRAYRNSSIELLRIIAILGVIVLHYNGSGGALSKVNDGSINQYYLYFMESLFICAVNLFVMISAYYLATTKKRRLTKVVELIVQVMVFNLIEYGLQIMIDGNKLTLHSIVSRLLPVNYFVILYAVLYMISPYINLAIEKLSKKDFKKLLILMVIIFSVWTILQDYSESLSERTFSGLSTIGLYGSQKGYSIVNFVVIYIVGAYIRLNEIKLKKRVAAIIIPVLVGVILSLSLIEHKIGLPTTTTWNYNNPFIIALAAAIMLLFLNYKYNNKIINELAGGTFTCFLFHAYWISKVHIEEYVNKPLYALVIHQVCVAVSLYLVSYVVYKVYSLGTGWLFKLISPVLDKVDLSVKDKAQ